MNTNIWRVVMNRKLLALMLLLPLFGYGQIFEEDYDYSKEFTWGVNKNTNSGLIGGFVMKFSKNIGDDLYRTLGFEIMNVKHPKEQRYISPQTGTPFIFGKQNFLYAIRAQYGLEKILYKKAPQQGVQIHAAAAAGPTLGIVAPYIVVSDGQSERYDPRVHTTPNAIQGSGRLFEGLCLGHFAPGVNAKTSTIFEFGTFRKSVAGVEIGVMAEVYTQRIILVPTQKNRALFTSAFFTLFWGSRK